MFIYLFYSSETSRLAMVTGNSAVVYLWTPHGALIVRIPPVLSTQDPGTEMIRPSRIEWNPLGKALGLVAKNQFVCSKIVTKKKSV